MPEQAIQCIVEGHGEVHSIGVLLRRLNPDAEVLRPLRLSRQQMTRADVLARSVELAARKLTQRQAISDRRLLVLLDADDDLPCELGPRILGLVRQSRPDVVSHVVVACREFEAWFLAAIESLRDFRGIPPDASPVRDPEAVRGAKEALGHLMGGHYDPMRDQPAFAARFDIRLARQRSPSFDKLMRDLDVVVDS